MNEKMNNTEATVKVVSANQFEELQNQMLKASAVLKNLQTCVENMFEVDVISSLDVLTDYIESMQTVIDSMERNNG